MGEVFRVGEVGQLELIWLAMREQDGMKVDISMGDVLSSKTL